MIQIKEAIINSVRPLKNRSLAVTFWIKSEDISKEDIERLQEYWTNEIPLAWVLQEFTGEVIEDIKPKLRQRIAILIKSYCEKENISEIDEIRRVYEKYWIQSRKDLDEKQLRELIDSYELWLQY